MNVTYVRVNGEAIGRILDKLDEAVDGEPSAHVAIACAAMVVLSQKPDIEQDKLQAAIKGMSEWLAAFLGPEEVIN